MLRNPYLNRSMIRSVDEFYGRGEPLQRAAARIGAPTPQSISLVGERRAGKSSLLWHLAQPEVHQRFLDEPSRYVFLMMDFQGQQHLDEPGFCRAFGEQLRETAQLEVPDLSDLSGIQSAVRALAQANLRLICLFDEFEMITRNPEFGAPFYGFLRSLANTHPVAFVTASRRPLETLCHNEEIADSPFFNIFTQVHVGPMPEAEVRQLIREPSAAAGLPLEPHAEAILSLSSQLPFFVQIACSAAFDHLGNNDGAFDQRAVERRFAEETNSHFRYLWDRLGERESDAVAALARGTPLSEDQREDLDALVDDGYVIARGDEYKLFSTAFVRFLRKNAAEAVPRTADVAKAKAGAPKVPRRVLIIAAVLVLLAAALAIYLATTSDTPEPVAAVSPPQAEGLQLSLALGNAQKAIPLGPFWSASRHRPELVDADHLQVQIQTGQAGYLYAFLLDHDGQLAHLAHTDDSALFALETGRLYSLPSNQPFAIDWTVPPSAIYIVFLPDRDRELEELYQRLERSTENEQQRMRHRLVGHIARRATNRLELPLAQLGTKGP
ncbi:MAG: hypothetical protein GKR89_37275 [Candidatus Latescibacteria bacterium]|nr:hypothetical protein [Candidatus Latescibacterota bacterium]